MPYYTILSSVKCDVEMLKIAEFRINGVGKMLVSSGGLGDVVGRDG